jgi:hypothetical protein
VAVAAVEVVGMAAAAEVAVDAVALAAIGDLQVVEASWR